MLLWIKHIFPMIPMPCRILSRIKIIYISRSGFVGFQLKYVLYRISWCYMCIDPFHNPLHTMLRSPSFRVARCFVEDRCLGVKSGLETSNRSSGLASTAWVLHHRLVPANKKIQSTWEQYYTGGGQEPIRLSPLHALDCWSTYFVFFWESLPIVLLCMHANLGPGSFCKTWVSCSNIYMHGLMHASI